MTKKQTRLALCAVVITVVATIVGCGGNGNPGGGDDRFTTFTLTTGADPAIGGTVSRDPHATSYQNGTSVILTVTPATGYRFVGWSDESIPAISPTTITIVRNTALIALFEPIPTDHHTLTVNANPAIGGMVSRNPDAPSYTHGTEVAVTATPAEGYRFINWSGASTSTNAEVKITVNGNMTLTANFELIGANVHTLTVNTNLPAGGTVSRNPDAPSYTHGTEVTVTATPAEGYTFINWSGASTSTNAVVKITVNSSMTLTANFEQKTHTLTTGLTPENSGTVWVNGTVSTGAVTYNYGTQISVTATAAAGYTFTGWSGASNSTNAALTITMDGDKELTANFQSNTYTLTTGVSSAGGGTVSRDPNQTEYAFGTQVTLTATPDNGYAFAGWSGAVTSTTPVLVTVMDGNKELTAHFELIPVNHFALVVNWNPLNGNVTRSLEATSYAAGTAVTVTAAAVAGYTFIGWTGSLADTSRTITVTVNSDMALTANFRANNYILTTAVTPAAGGSVTPASGQSHSANTPINIAVIAASGYRFVSWEVTSGTATLGNASNASTTVTLGSNATIRANFVQTCILTVDRDPTVGGTVTPASWQSYDVNTPVSITATAATGYRFVNWTVTSGTATVASATNANTTVTLSTNATIRANFRQIFALTITRSPIDAAGTFTPASGQTYDANTPVSITATAASGYRFVNWTVTGGTAMFASATSANTTVTLSSNATIRANFQQTGVLTIDRNPIAGGTVTPASGQSHDVNTPISITATVTSGYRFLNWTVTSASGTATFANANDAVTTVTLSSNATIRANFSAPVTLTVNHSPTASGTVTPTSQSGITVGTPINISATASSGYEFFNWTVTSGTATFANANNAVTTVTLSSNATIRANFQLIPPTPGSQFNPNVTYGSFTDSRDSRVYRTVRIGNQTWMAENLNWAGDDGNLGACYNNSASNCNFYGRLYNWNTVMAGSPSSSTSPSGVQGICPSGWHVPSDAEWTALTSFVGSNAGTKLKSTIGWNSGGNGTDDFGFSALPGGNDNGSGNFRNVGYSGLWWSATEIDASSAWNRDMGSGFSSMFRGSSIKTGLFSLRCLEDNAAP